MRVFLYLGFLLATVTAPAQLGHEIARQHAERAGDRLATLTALRIEGRTFINDEVVPFTLVAQRPNRLRVESFTPLRRVIQVYEGKNAPWISHSDVKDGAPQDMVKVDAKDFIANADFDGPLVPTVFAPGHVVAAFATAQHSNGAPVAWTVVGSDGVARTAAAAPQLAPTISTSLPGPGGAKDCSHG